MARSRSRNPLTRKQFEDLLNHLEDQLSAEDCDQTLRHSEAFFRKRAIDVRAARKWLKWHGGFCDCEVLMNVAGL